jgi:restriction endonuclease S subunit
MTRPSRQSERRTYRLGDVLTRHNEIIHPGDRKAGEAVFVGLEHIEPETGRRIGSRTIDLGKLTGRKPTFRAGQIVYGYLRPYLNKVWVSEFDGCSSVDQFAFNVRGDIADTQYVAAFMRSDTFLRRSAVVTTTGQLPRISIEEIEAVEVELPPLAEQRRISTKLRATMASVKAARGAAEERLAAAEVLPAAYLREVFGVTEWPLAQLHDVSRVVTDGTHLPPPFTDYGVPFLFVRNMVAGRIDLDVAKYISEETYHELTQKHRAERGDLLYSAVGSFGVAVVVQTDARFAFQRHIAHIKPDSERVDPHFLAHFLNSPRGRAQSEAVATGGGQRTVTLTDLRKFQVPVPPLPEQQRIAENLGKHLSSAELIITRCREELAAIKALPAALLREAFSGEPASEIS